MKDTKMHTSLLTTQQMSLADQSAAEYISTEDLMENAGRAVSNLIMRRWQPCEVLILCGSGNNGGDGFVVARLLDEAGWKVRLCMLGEIDTLPQPAKFHAQLWPGKISPLNLEAYDGINLVVDALFGAGLNRPLDESLIKLLAKASELKLPVVAIDIPSGVNGNTGESFGAIAATVTVTFFRKKSGHLLIPGRLLCGEIVLEDIGIKNDVLDEIQPTCFENHPKLWQTSLPKPTALSHKYNRGSALVFGGYPITGAARLAATANARTGCGLTKIIVPEIAYPIYATALTSIMLHPYKTLDEIDSAIEEPRFSAYLIGPGAKVNLETKNIALKMLATNKPVVMDAGAIMSFKDDLNALINLQHKICVMTPHEGEFSNLFKLSGDKLSRAREAAKLSGAIIILKGYDTVIAAPDGRAIINSNAPATLATAGSGDVLSGITLGLLAQGMDPFLAAAAAVWMHTEAANEFGYGLIAEDLIEMLPKVLQKLII